MECYIFDLDGTLADQAHRHHLIEQDPPDWDTYYTLCHLDSPIPHIVMLAGSLLDAGTRLVFASARSEICRAQTVEWLERHDLRGELYLRRMGDHRPDYIVKEEILDQILADGWIPQMVFEDRTRVVEMWRVRGIPCAQIAPGDY